MLSADSNDPNIIFANELPSTTDSSVLISNTKKTVHKDHSLARVILNPIKHSKIACEFLLVQGGLTDEETNRFHRPRFPIRELHLQV